MRIVHILNHVDEVGNGIVNVAVDLACLQQGAGHDVLVLSGGGSFERLLEQHGVQHRVVEQERRPLALLQALRRFRAEVGLFRPHIVHAHMMTGAVLAKLGYARPPYRLVTHVHNEFQHAAILMGVGARVIAVSAAVAALMQQRGIPERKLRVVRNATIGSPRYQRLHHYQPAALQHPAIVTVSGMYKRKGILDLIEAFDGVAAQIQGVQLYLVGDGPDRLFFESVARKLPSAPQIHFEKFQKQPQTYLLAADIFVLPSHKESFGLAIVEAREAGCAIVASDIDGIPEALDNGSAGLLVPVKNPTALREKITALLLDKDELDQWRLKAQSNLDKFNVLHMTRQIEAVYEELLAGRQG